MAQGDHKINEIIEVTYQAAGSTIELTDVTMEIFDETGAQDTANFPNVIMVEISGTGRYKGPFTPDAEGKWRVMINSATKEGKIVKDFDIVAHNVDSVGDAIATTDGKIDTIDGKINNLGASGPMIG